MENYDNDILNLENSVKNLSITKNSENIKKLKEYLDGIKIGHDEQILKLPTLKNAVIYCIINNLKSQQYGIYLESYIKNKFNYKTNKSSDCVGDCNNLKDNIEIKMSLGGSNYKKFNFVQIRLFHNCEIYILVAYHLSHQNVENEGELYIFKISKSDIKKIILSYGSYAHGTIKKNGKITKELLDDKNNKYEYAIRTTFNDDCWKMLNEFKISENEL